MNVDFIDPATFEFYDAINFYNSESEGLGYEFASEVKLTIKRIIEYTQAWTPLSKRTRRCRTNRFPYGIIYQVRDDTILIVAVMHLSRHPEYWKDRLKPDVL